MENLKKILGELGCPTSKNGSFMSKKTKKYQLWFAQLPKNSQDKILKTEEDELFFKKSLSKANAWKKHETVLATYPENASNDDIVKWANGIRSKNQNDKILTANEIKKEATLFKDFEFIRSQPFKDDEDYDEFVLAGTISCEKPTLVQIESLKYLLESDIKISLNPNISTNVAERLMYDIKGLVYIFTCIIDFEEYLIKIGETGETMYHRISSYNCGTNLNRSNGTCSTTNYKFKQMLASAGLIFNVYILDCSKYNSIKTVGNTSSSETCGALPRQMEEITVAEYEKQYNKKPIGNVQTGKLK